MGIENVQNAFLTCWTKRDIVVEQLKKAGINFSAVGQLYGTRGISPFIRNLLANKFIKRVFVIGRDLSKSIQVLTDWWYAPHKEIKGLEDISQESINLLRKNVNLYNYSGYKNLQEILEDENFRFLIDEWREGWKKSWGKNEVYSIPKVEIENYPSAYFGHQVQGDNIIEVYLKMLAYILRFGKISNTHYDERQKEVLSLQTIINSQEQVYQDDKIQCDIPDWLPNSKEHLIEYINERIFSPLCPEGIQYTYGNRIFGFKKVINESPFAFETAVDQFDLAVIKMLDNLDQRSCVISLWNPCEDTALKSGTPCINHIWFRISENKLHMHVTIRSNDMFGGWIENAFAMRVLQERFLNRLILNLKTEKRYKENLSIGSLCMTSLSAHLYESTWDSAKEMIEKYYSKYVKCPWVEWDKKGQFEVSIKDGELIVQLFSPDQNIVEPVQEFKGTTAYEVCHKILRSNACGTISNAMYLARKLMKLELRKNQV